MAPGVQKELTALSTQEGKADEQVSSRVCFLVTHIIPPQKQILWHFAELWTAMATVY